MATCPPLPIPRHRVFHYADFNLDALLALAGGLRGVACTCDLSTLPKAGGLNWVIFVKFDDEIEWVFRSPHRIMSPMVTDATAAKMLESEVATLKYLKSRTSIPVPEVYSYW